jgi:hypothetical protein
MKSTRQLNSFQNETGATKTQQKLKKKLFPAQIGHQDCLILRLLHDAVPASDVTESNETGR